MKVFFVSRKNYIKIIFTFLYALFSSNVSARGYESYLEATGEGGGGGFSDISTLLITVVVIAIFLYNFYQSSEFRKSVFHVVFFIGFVFIFPLALFIDDQQNKEWGIIMIFPMYFIHKFIYFVINKYNDKSNSTITTDLKKKFDNVSSLPVKSKPLIVENSFPSEYEYIKSNFDNVKASVKPDVAKKIIASLDSSENLNKPDPKKNKQISSLIDNLNYKNYLSESFPSNKPFFSEPTKTDRGATYDINRKIPEIKLSKPKEIASLDLIDIRKNCAKALFGIRIQSELKNLSLKDKMLWRECKIETKDDERSAVLLYRVAREKFLFKSNQSLISDRFGADIIDSNLNYCFCASMNEAKKLAFSS